MRQLPIYINIVFEDLLSEAVIERLLTHETDRFVIDKRLPGRGCGYIQSKINIFVQASIVQPFFILMDSDRESCAITVLNNMVPHNQRRQSCLFRIAVHEVESWLLADRKGFSNLLGIPCTMIPVNPESIEDPKQYLINLAKKSRFRNVRDDLVPASNTSAIQGRGYNQFLTRFVRDIWDIKAASLHSESLRRAINAVHSYI
jgi:hypothetical protein